MAFSDKEKQIIKRGKQKGKSDTEIMLALDRFRSQGGFERKGFLEGSINLSNVDERLNQVVENVRSGFETRAEETSEDIKQMQEGINQALETRRGQAEGIEESADKVSPVRTNIRRAGAGLGLMMDVVGEVVIGGAKGLLSQEQEDQVKEGFMESGEKGIEALTKVANVGLDEDVEVTPQMVKENIGETVINTAEKMQKLEQENPELAKDIRAILPIGELVSDLFGGRAAKPAIRQVGDVFSEGLKKAKTQVDDAIGQVRQGMGTIFTKTKHESIDDVIKETESFVDNNPQAVDIPESKRAQKVSETRAEVEEEAVEPSIRGKFTLNLSPAQSLRLRKAGPEKTQEYIDVVVARNLNDEAPPVMEHGGDVVRQTVKDLNRILNDTGSDIGQARKKLSTVEVPQPTRQRVENTFKKELDKLKLEVRDGEVVEKAGKISNLGSRSDLRVLNDLWQDIQTAKQSRKLTDWIDLRNAFDSKVKFGKRAGEVSSSVDGVSRSVRKDIKNAMNEVVGKEKAQDVQKYADVINARNTLREFTDRRAGGEYLLRLAQSGRGGEAKEIMRTVKDITGRDLMNDSALTVLVTDLLATQDQKTLFAQQITKAGLDAGEVLRAMKGDPGSMASTAAKVFNLVRDKDKAIEKALRKEANLPINE